MILIGLKFRLLFLAALVIATTFACNDQLDGGTNSYKVECPLGQNCDGGAGQGGVVAQGESGTEDTATGGTTVVAGSGGVLTDAAAIAVDAASDSVITPNTNDSGIIGSVDAISEVGLEESGAIDAPSIGDENPVGTDSTVDTGGIDGSIEPCEGGRVDGSEAKSLVTQGALLLDVRTPAEFAADAIPDAINIPLGELANRLNELPTDRIIITYCRSGNRSGQAAQMLLNEGFIVCDLGPRSAWDE